MLHPDDYNDFPRCTYIVPNNLPEGVRQLQVGYTLFTDDVDYTIQYLLMTSTRRLHNVYRQHQPVGYTMFTDDNQPVEYTMFTDDVMVHLQLQLIDCLRHFMFIQISQFYCFIVAYLPDLVWPDPFDFKHS